MFEEVHGKRYDYSLIEYKDTMTPVKIICKDHGVFEQAPEQHKAGVGCPGCRTINASRTRRARWLEENDIYGTYEEWKDYSRVVKYLTGITYKKYKNEINPNDLPLGRANTAYQIDHKFSIFEGWKNNIEPVVMASKYNLEMLPGRLNNKKNIKCSITKEELLEDYYATKGTFR